jgi:signal transduction histidine kinase
MTIRLKLTLLYGALFLIAGLALLSITYGLILQELRGVNSLSAPAETFIVPDSDGAPGQVTITDPPQARIVDIVERAQRAERREALATLRRQSLWALLVMTGGALGLGWLISGRVLDPIRRITAHAQSSSASTLDRRIQFEGPPDELKELADTFDAMLDRLQAAFRAQQNFAAEASHEIRTPLAIIRAEADLMESVPDAGPEDKARADAILTAVLRSERLIDGLLALTQSESTLLHSEPVDLADLTGDVVGEHLIEASEAQVTIDLDQEQAPVEGDPALLSRMVANLVQNAIRYNQPGGTASVSVRRLERQAVLVVENTGEVITQEQIDDLFRPFVRGEWARRNRAGFGIGLSVVQSVARAHQGTVRATPGPAGGLRVEVRLPLATWSTRPGIGPTALS